MKMQKLGTLVDQKYILQKLIEKSELGASYEVWHIPSKQKLVAKIISELPMENWHSRFLKEGQTWLELGHHVNIVCAHFVRKIDDALYMFLERVEGKRLSETQLDFDQESFAKTLKIAIQIAHAMCYLHEENVAHKNLRADNIIIAPQGRIKLNNIRWAAWEGLENHVKGLRTSFLKKGEALDISWVGKARKRLAYLAPEYFLSKSLSENDMLAMDVYAFGVLLYQICCDEFPCYDAVSPIKELFAGYKRLYKEFHIPSLNEKFPKIPEFCSLILNCLAKSPNERPSFSTIKKQLCEIYCKHNQKEYAFENWHETDLLSMSLNNRAMGSIDIGDFEASEKILEEVSLLNTRKVAAPLNLNLLQLRSGKISVKQFLDATNIYKPIDLKKILCIQGFVCLEYGCFVQDVLEEIEALPSEQKDFEFLFLEANLNYRMARYQVSLEMFKKLVKQEGAVQDLWFRLGANFLALGALGEARKAWEIGLRAQLPIVDLLISYGTLLAMDKDWVKARQYFDEGIKNITHYQPSAKTEYAWSHVRTFEIPSEYPVTDVDVASDHFYVKTLDGKNYAWEWPSGKPKNQITNLPLSRKASSTSRISKKFLKTKISYVVFANEGKSSISIHGDPEIKVWDMQRAKNIFNLEGHTHTVTSVAVTPDGKGAVSGSLDKTVRVWDVVNGDCMIVFEGHTDCVNCVAISDDGVVAASGGWDRKIKVWDILGEKCIANLKGHNSDIVAICISSDGKIVVSGDALGNVHIWDVPTQKTVAMLEGHSKRIAGIAISRDKSVVYSASMDGSVRVYEDISKRSCPCWIKTPYVSGKFPAPIPLEQREELKMWEQKANKASEAQEIINAYQKTLETPHTHIYKTAMDKISSVAIEKELLPKKLQKYREVALFPHKKHLVAFLSISSDCFFSVSEDSRLHRWQISDGSCDIFWEKATCQIKCLTMSVDRKMLCFGGADRKIHIWRPDMDSWKTLEGHTGSIYCIALADQDKRLLTAGADGTLQIWDTVTGKPKNICIGRSGISGLGVSSNDILAVTSCLDGSVRTWDIDSGECVASSQKLKEPLTCIEFSPQDHNNLISGGLDGCIRSWSVRSARCNYVVKAHEAGITSLSLQEKGKLVLLGGLDGVIKLWDSEEDECVAKIKAHNGPVTQVYLSPNGFWGYSAGKDCLVKLWAFEWEF